MPMNPRLLRPTTSVHPEAADWANRVITNGGTVSGSTLNEVSSFCRRIDAAGIRDRFFRLNLFCGNSDASLNAVRTPLFRGPSRTGTQYGNTTDTNFNFVQGDYAETGASGGLTGNGSSKYLNTGLPATYPPTAGDRHTSVYISTLSTGDALIGVYDTPPVFYYELFVSSDQVRYFINVGTTENLSYARSAGLWQANGTTTRVLYKDGASVATGSGGIDSVSTSTRPFFIFATNNVGNPSAPYAGRLAAYSIGLSMGDTQAALYSTAMTAFQAALGRNV